MGAVGALLQGVCTASVTEHFGWDALFALLCLLSMASALLLLPACLDEGRLSRHLLLGDCRVPCAFLPKRVSPSGGGSREGDGDNILASEEQGERGNLLLKFPKHRGRGPTVPRAYDVFEEEEEMDDIMNSPATPKKKSLSLSLSSTSAFTHFRKGHQDRRKGRKERIENAKEKEDEEEEREALHCGGYEASQQGGGEMIVRGFVACTRGKGEGRRTENEFV
ncbi:zinc finger protein 36 family 3 protein [Cystoisospora suis]|uniref:Zinc finger protein 36 family 3 protein n=1 Tax=Cystoisospora suis TaxID=483139 RepID=A0A2C6KMT7_9APIC|nr:zinc finger protein 36 family 3 protein [Cystoisospora suis]